MSDGASSSSGHSSEIKSREKDVRASNITAAKCTRKTRITISKASTAFFCLRASSCTISNGVLDGLQCVAVADAIRTSLGPKGMDKMVRLDKIFVLEFAWGFSAYIMHNLPQGRLITIDETCDCLDI